MFGALALAAAAQEQGGEAQELLAEIKALRQELHLLRSPAQDALPQAPAHENNLMHLREEHRWGFSYLTGLLHFSPRYTLLTLKGHKNAMQ